MTTARLTVVLAADPDAPPTAAQLAKLLALAGGGTDVVVAGPVTGGDALPEAVARRTRVLDGPFPTLAEAFAAGFRLAETDLVAFATPADRHLHRRLAARVEALSRSGRPALAHADAPDRAWPAPRRAPSILSDVLSGRVRADALVAERAAVTAVGGIDETAGRHALSDLLVRLAVADKLATVVDPENPDRRGSPPEADFDAFLARALAQADGPAVAAAFAAGRLVPHPGWPRTGDLLRRALVALGRSVEIVTVASAADRPLAALRAAAAASEAPYLVVSVTEPARVRLGAQVARLEAAEAAACLPIVDDGLFRMSTVGPLVGTVFRTDAVRACPQTADEGGFWLRLAAAGPIAALADAAPGRAADAAEAWWPDDRDGGLPPSLLVDADWYKTRYPDIAAAGVDPTVHYLGTGWRERRDPSRWFSAVWYATQPGVEAGVSPLDHFTETGAAQGLDPHPDVKLARYAAVVLGSPRASAEALRHLMDRAPEDGDFPGAIRIERLVDPVWYLAAHADVRAAGIDPVRHYLATRHTERRRPNPWYDPVHYRAVAGLDPEEDGERHFLRFGAYAGLSPHPDLDLVFYAWNRLGEGPSSDAYFHLLAHWRVEDPQLARTVPVRPLTGVEQATLKALVDGPWYAAAYPDVAAGGVDPAVHYFQTGWAEGREPNPWFSSAWYRAAAAVRLEGPAPELTHFVRVGAARGFAPHPEIDLARYVLHHPDAGEGAAALVHLVAHWARPDFVLRPDFDNALVAAFLGGLPLPERRDQMLRLLRMAEAARAPAFDAGPPAPPAIADYVDAAWYHRRHPDVAARGTTPAADYAERGWKNGRDPSPVFSASWYLDAHPDVAEAGLEPLAHYVAIGRHEGRRPDALFDPAWYAARYGLPAEEAFHDYGTAGVRAGRMPSAAFDHPAVRVHLMERAPADRADVLRRLQEAADAAAAGPVVVPTNRLGLWRTVLLWSLPPRAVPVVLPEDGETAAVREPSAAILRVARSDGAIELRTETAIPDIALRFTDARAEATFDAFLRLIGAEIADGRSSARDRDDDTADRVAV